ncbi:TPA: LysR family substrate-binding domain-containing protein [Pseudomonas aeruginosa]|uniref:LysR family substrate-binding domain-containing protein n=1 Tax=Pseudomonas nitroreducens TaxID=46680 RepID=A0A6G6ISK2_PSENT|nr:MULTISPECIES: LysR family substrate-binding domain-containing protein [Pseudomonas aeruginosa group]KYO75083.1 transcriptional regulator Cbl [Pseudomonas aeruginosa]QIE85974.1 LysR family substrate-binding domain-containing protein [Pseudomonas nitroreducens]HCE6398723.1 LysR family substrate-binding domain-containing protein [Pseudomonas aeruginosa]
MLENHDYAPLHIAVAPNAQFLPLGALLAKQRAEEPETPIHVIETTKQEQEKGLIEGRYALGLSIAVPEEDSLSSVPFWRDELAVAVPLRSPLLAFAEISLEQLARYPLILLNQGSCEKPGLLIDSLLKAAKTAPTIAEQVQSFELMMTLIAAGYGVGIWTKSRISASRKIGVIMRPLAGKPHYITTHLIQPCRPRSNAVDRLIQRALTTQMPC